MSLSTFINSISYNVSIKNINLKKINSQYCDSGVDVHSSILLDFDKKFTSHITCSFKEKMNQNTRINFTNGFILIEDTWVPGKNMQIIIFEKNKEKKKLSISGNIKKSIKNIEIAKTKGKNSVFIEKKSGKFQGKGSSSQVSERRHVQKNKNSSDSS